MRGNRCMCNGSINFFVWFCEVRLKASTKSLTCELTLLRNVFLTRSVLPEGKTPEVRGMGGSPSFCCRLSATTRNALRPMDILSGVRMILKGRATDNRSNTISLIAKSSLSYNS